MDIIKSLFGGGIPHLEPAEVQPRLEAKPASLLLDVREADEYRAGHVAGAKLIPLGELQGRIKEVAKDREILCICASGSRSSVAVRQLIKLGYRAVNVRGGMGSWQRAGLPVKKGASR